MRLLAFLALLVVGMSSLGCRGEQIHSENPFVEYPKIRTIAVAPFLVTPEIATVPSQFFQATPLITRDGFTAWYSEELAREFAISLGGFPDLTVVMPADVERAWKASIAEQQEFNPLADREGAVTIARKLGADAIIVGDLRDWDPFTPSMSLNWSLYYTRARETGASDIRETERMPGSEKSGRMDIDYAREPVYTEQLILNAEQIQTMKWLSRYSVSLNDLAPYEDTKQSIMQRPWPRFVRFAAWVAMTRAYEHERLRHS